MSNEQSGSTANGHAHELKGYALPTNVLAKKLSPRDRGRTPLILVSCGSFSPVTYLHLRMFEMARDWARKTTHFSVIGGCAFLDLIRKRRPANFRVDLSPVGDAYVKKGLAPAEDRVAMCRLAVDNQELAPKFVMVDNWEASQSKYQPTAHVLDHINYEINEKLGGIDDGTGTKVKAQIALLAGADLVETFTQPGIWSDDDLDHILIDYGAFIIERVGTDIDDALNKLRSQWREHIKVIHQQIRNDVSSTKIRAFLGEDMSIRYLVPEPVIKYIEDHRLYGVHPPEVNDDMS